MNKPAFCTDCERGYPPAECHQVGHDDIADLQKQLDAERAARAEAEATRDRLQFNVNEHVGAWCQVQTVVTVRNESLVEATVRTIRDLRAHLSAATRERDEWEANEQEMHRRLQAATRDLAEARDALQRYGEHDGDCAASVVGCAGDTKCTCGYDSALASSSRPDGER